MYVVAGVTGHVGSVVASELLKQKTPVTVLLRDAAKAAQWQARGATVKLGSLGDTAFVASSLAEASAFFVLQPPNFGAKSFLAEQRELADSVASAVRQSGVTHVVLLSSVGAHLPDGTGPIQGLYHFERALADTGTVLGALRASNFQENVAHAVELARTAGIFVSMAPGPDEAFPRIATSDIGRFAAATLLSPRSASTVWNLLGPVYSNREIALSLGAAIGRELKVLEVPRAGWESGFQKGGMSPEIAALFAEMFEALDKGLLVPAGGQIEQCTTPIEQTIELLLHPPDAAER